MVDFQSRDTRRGPTTDDESEDGDDEHTADEERSDGDDHTADEPTAESDTETASDDPSAAATPADESTDSDPDGGGPADDTDDGTADTDQSADPLAGPTSDDTDDGAADTQQPDDQLAGPAPDDTDDRMADTDQSADPLADSTSDDTDDGTVDTDQSADPLADSTSDDTDDGENRDEPTAVDPAETAPAHSDAPAAASTSAEPARSVAVGIVTVGVARESVEEAVATAFESAGHTVATRERLRGEYDTIQQVTDRLVGRGDVDVVVTAGGVGLGANEMAIEAVHPLLEKALPGFGEAFRSLLFERIGTGIVAVRTAAGVADGTLVFCLPGDPEAAAVAVEEILATEAPVLVDHLDG